LTIADPKHRHRLKEMTRLREALLDFFLGDNESRSTSIYSNFVGASFCSIPRKKRAANSSTKTVA